MTLSYLHMTAAERDNKPTPLTAGRDLPPFPVSSLPAVFAAEIMAVATFTQTDPGMAGSAVLGTLAACAGGRCELEVRSGWREPLNLFVATCAGPGERKSAVKNIISAPLLEAERDLVEEAREAIVTAQTERDIAMKTAEKAKAVAGNSDDKSSAASAVSAALHAESVVVPSMPRIVADDVTPEAAGSLLAEQHGRLAIISAEGGVFDIIAGRYSGAITNLDVWLKGHAGDMLKVDRKGRPPEYVPKPALTVAVMIQPAVLEAIARNGAFRGRGLLARFLYCLPPSKVGHRIIDAPAVPEDVHDAYEAAVKELAVTLAGWEDPVPVKLTDEALAELLAFASGVEHDLRPAARLGHVRDWGSKLVGATARIAGLLHVAEDPADAWRRSVEVDAVRNAIELANYFTAHALAAFDAMQADPLVADATYALDVIRREEWETFSKRDLFSKSSRSRFPKAVDLDPVLQRLEEHDYVAPMEVDKPAGKGRPPSPTWAVNPWVHIGTTPAEIAQTAERRSP